MGGPLILYFPGKEPPHKEFLGWDPNWGIFWVFLYVYVLFSLVKTSSIMRSPVGRSKKLLSSLHCGPIGLVQVSKQPKCPKMLTESANGVFGPPEWESQNRLLHAAKPCFGLFPPVRNRVYMVRETLLGLSAQRHQITFSTLLKHFCGHFRCFDTCTRPAGPQSLQQTITSTFLWEWFFRILRKISNFKISSWDPWFLKNRAWTKHNVSIAAASAGCRIEKPSNLIAKSRK